MQPQQPYTGQIFQPTQTYTPSASQSMYSNSFDDEPPLLEGIGAPPFYSYALQTTVTKVLARHSNAMYCNTTQVQILFFLCGS